MEKGKQKYNQHLIIRPDMKNSVVYVVSKPVTTTSLLLVFAEFLNRNWNRRELSSVFIVDVKVVPVVISFNKKRVFLKLCTFITTLYILVDYNYTKKVFFIKYLKSSLVWLL